MVKKLSLDPRGKCMLPRPGGWRKRRNEISWSGFEMNDAELDGVLDEVMDGKILHFVLIRHNAIESNDRDANGKCQK